MTEKKKWDIEERSAIFLELISIVDQFCLLLTIAKHCFLILESLIMQLSIVKSMSIYYNFHHQYVIFIQFSDMYVDFHAPKWNL